MRGKGNVAFSLLAGFSGVVADNSEFSILKSPSVNGASFAKLVRSCLEMPLQ
jgi:hypothetical protein